MSNDADDEQQPRIRVLGGQTFAEATSGVPDAVKEIVGAVGISTADATHILKQYGQEWRELLAPDQRGVRDA